MSTDVATSSTPTLMKRSDDPQSAARCSMSGSSRAGSLDRITRRGDGTAAEDERARTERDARRISARAPMALAVVARRGGRRHTEAPSAARGR